MNDTKPVIVASDGSDHSLRMLPHAATLAENLGSGLQLLRVVEESEIAVRPGESRDEAVQRAVAQIGKDLESELNRIGIAGEPVVEVAKEGEKPEDALLRLTALGRVMAMHSRGRSGLAHLLRGSVALAVLSRVEVPVMLGGPALLAPPAKSERFLVQVTSDLSPASEDVMRAIAPLLEQGSFSVSLLHIHEHAPGGQDNEAELAKARSDLDRQRLLFGQSVPVEVSVREIPRGAGVDTAIIEKAREDNAQAIAMSTHGHSAKRHLLMGSVALSVLDRSVVPLLVARA